MNLAMLALTAAAMIAQNSATSTEAPATSNPSNPATWTSSVDLANYLPCNRWRRNPNGTWTLMGTVHLGGMTMTDVAFGSGRESQILEKRCGSMK